MTGGSIVINGEAIAADDVRLTPGYYAYYYSQRPLDPRLPPPLYNWSRWHAGQKQGEDLASGSASLELLNSPELFGQQVRVCLVC